MGLLSRRLCPWWQPVLRTILAAVLALLPAGLRAEIRTDLRSDASGGVEPILRLAVEERYDDDVLLTGSQDAPGAFLTKIMPQVGLRLNQRRTQLETFYGPDVLYRSGSGEVQLDHRVALELHTELSRTAHLDAVGRFWDTSDPLALPRQGLARTLARTYYGIGQLGGRQEVAPR